MTERCYHCGEDFGLHTPVCWECYNVLDDSFDEIKERMVNAEAKLKKTADELERIDRTFMDDEVGDVPLHWVLQQLRKLAKELRG